MLTAETKPHRKESNNAQMLIAETKPHREESNNAHSRN